MKKEEVPQQSGIQEQWTTIKYAVSEDGKYSMEKSKGSETVNVTNAHAWETFEEQAQAARNAILEGELSPLAYHMAVAQMDVKLLCSYSGISRWKIKRHLKPKHFAKLDRKTAEKYSHLFKLSIEDFLNPF